MNSTRLRYLRRWYFAGLTAAMVILVLVRFFVIGVVVDGSSEAAQVAAQAVNDLIGSTLAAAFVAGLLAWLLPTDDDTGPQVTILQNWEIEPEIREACNETTEWRIRARTASYFRATTLHWLDEHARIRRVSTKVYVQVMDPSDGELHRLYLQFPGRIQDEKWNEHRVRIEIYASIISLLAHQAANPRLEIELRTARNFEVLSLDISNSRAIMTGQYNGHPAISCSGSSAFYSTLRDEFDAAWQQGKEISMSVSCPPLQDLKSAEVKSILNGMNVGAEILDDSDFGDIAEYAKRPEPGYR